MHFAGACRCGAIAYDVADGAVDFRVFCHCRACVEAAGCSPVHIVAIRPPGALRLTKGADVLAVTGPSGPNGMTRASCGSCGTLVHQGPHSAPFRGVLASTITSAELLRPTAHINYDSRTADAIDDLPKFGGFPPASGAPGEFVWA